MHDTVTRGALIFDGSGTVGAPATSPPPNSTFVHQASCVTTKGRELMKHMSKITALVLAVCITTAVLTTRARADEYPVVLGDYWEVTGVKLKDGGGLIYANHLAGEWRANQEFAKSKGWIKGYLLFQNSYPRAGEPDLYLVTIRSYVESGTETEQRNAEFMEWKKKTVAQMEKETGDRAEYREIVDNFLLQELKFRN
jgi:hypothetical protein